MRSAGAGVALAIVLAMIVCAGATAAAIATPVGTFKGCPVGLLPPPSRPGQYTSPVRLTALHFLHTTIAQLNREHHWRLRLQGAQAAKVLLVRHWLPSGWIKSECGTTVWQRSVVVSIWLPAMEYPNPKGPCNSCARMDLLLGKTDRGWIVWGQY